MPYTATISGPGYLPDSAEPAPVFDTPTEAWEHLLDVRREQEDEVADPKGYTACLNTLERLSQGNFEAWDDGTGMVSGETPGYTGDHDLGLSYVVTEVEPEA